MAHKSSTSFNTVSMNLCLRDPAMLSVVDPHTFRHQTETSTKGTEFNFLVLHDDP